MEEVLLHSADQDARSLLAAAQPDWNRAVPHCPTWDTAELVRHMGGILAWMAAIVTSRQRVSRRTLPPPPADPGELPAWYLARLDEALDVLGSADRQAATWTFSSTGDHRVAWWNRRLAAEVAVHRWDAQDAASVGGGPAPRPIGGDVAAAGVAEFMTEFLPGLLSGAPAGALGGTLHLHATDGPTEWWTDLDAPAPAVSGHLKADTAVRGTRSDLLLWLNNRGAADRLDVFGPREIVDHWKQLEF